MLVVVSPRNNSHVAEELDPAFSRFNLSVVVLCEPVQGIEKRLRPGWMR